MIPHYYKTVAVLFDWARQKARNKVTTELTTTAQQEAALAILKPHELVQQTEDRIMALVNDGIIEMPDGYKAGNAMKSAWLKLQETETKSGAPVLESCTKVSIANALLNMAIQGLNPGRDQVYFIAYGKKLTAMISRFGYHAIAKRFGAKEIYSAVMYAGDEVIFRTVKGRKIIDSHVQKFTNVNDANIIGAYCTIEFADGRPDYTEIMNIDQIHKSWAQSKLDWKKADSTHGKFPVEMCRRTVENKACKYVIKSANDNETFMAAFNEASDEIAIAQHEESVEVGANSIPLEIPAVVVEHEVNPETTALEEAMEPAALKGEVVTKAEAEVMPAPEEPPAPVAPWFGLCPLHDKTELLPDTKGWSKTGFYCPDPEKMPRIVKGELSMDAPVGCRAHGIDPATGELWQPVKVRRYRDFMGKGVPEDPRLAFALDYTTEAPDDQGKLPMEPETPQTQAEIIEEQEAEDAAENKSDQIPF